MRLVAFDGTAAVLWPRDRRHRTALAKASISGWDEETEGRHHEHSTGDGRSENGESVGGGRSEGPDAGAAE